MRNDRTSYRNGLRALALCLSLLFPALIGCEDNTPVTPPPPPPEVEYRIVTLAPAMTQFVNDLGMADKIVGVSQNDAAAPTDAEIVGNFQAIDYEKLLSLDPTHVLMMTDKYGTPAQLKEFAEEGKFVLASYPHPSNDWDIYNILIAGSSDALVVGAPRVLQESGRNDSSLGWILDRYEQAQDNVDRIQRQLRVLSNVTSAGKKSQKVLMLIGTDPYMASGKNTINDRILWRQAHAFNAAFDMKVSAPTFDAERIQSLRPGVIVFVLPGAPPLGKLTEDPRTKPLMELDIPAVQSRPPRIHLINHPLAGLPSSSLPTAAAELAKAVHPQLAESIDKAIEETRQRATPEPEDGAGASEGSVDRDAPGDDNAPAAEPKPAAN